MEKISNCLSCLLGFRYFHAIVMLFDVALFYTLQFATYRTIHNNIYYSFMHCTDKQLMSLVYSYRFSPFINFLAHKCRHSSEFHLVQYAHNGI